MRADLDFTGTVRDLALGHAVALFKAKPEDFSPQDVISCAAVFEAYLEGGEQAVVEQTERSIQRVQDMINKVVGPAPEESVVLNYCRFAEEGDET